MLGRDTVVIAFSDGRLPLRRRDMIVDNPETLVREFRDLNGNLCFQIDALTLVANASQVLEPWGMYAPDKKTPISTLAREAVQYWHEANRAALDVLLGSRGLEETLPYRDRHSAAMQRLSDAL